MGRLLAWLAGTLLLLVLAGGGLLLASIDSQPLVSRGETITPLSVAQARFLLKTNDPRRLRSGEARQTAIPAALIDEGINYIASRFLHGRGDLVLGKENAEIRITLRPPLLAGERFINLSATVHQTEGEPRIAAAKIGSLPIPAALLEFALATGVRLAGYEREWNLARHAIRELKFEPQRQRVIVSYVWEPALLERARSVAVSRDDLARMRSAQEMLAAMLDHKAAGSRAALPAVLGPMLDVNGSDQRENRRVALFVLAAYLSGQLEARDEILGRRSALWHRYRDALSTVADRLGITLPVVPEGDTSAWHMFHLLIDGEHRRNRVLARLHADGIGATFHYQPLHSSPAGRRLADRTAHCPVTDRVADQLLRLPFHNRLAPAQADRVLDSLTRALEEV